MNIIHLKEVDSTNIYLLDNADRFSNEEMTVAVTDYQTAGRGMGTNTWESEPDKNLLFSILIHPTWLDPYMQYIISMAHALSLYDVLSSYSEDITIKWPNDIYWKERKISGTRIDGNISAGKLSDMVIGTGININQNTFNGTAPNPVSLTQITGKTYDRQAILNDIITRFRHYLGIAHEEWTTRKECKTIHSEYHRHLFRKEGIHSYEDANGQFDARLVEVLPNGIMRLERTDGTISEYEFKEVKYCLEETNGNK